MAPSFFASPVMRLGVSYLFLCRLSVRNNIGRADAVLGPQILLDGVRCPQPPKAVGIIIPCYHLPPRSVHSRYYLITDASTFATSPAWYGRRLQAGDTLIEMEGGAGPAQIISAGPAFAAGAAQI